MSLYKLKNCQKHWWVGVSLVGIKLLAIEARIVIASVEIYLKYSEIVAFTPIAAPQKVFQERKQTQG